MYNAHPYFSLKNLGKKSARYTRQNRVCLLADSFALMWPTADQGGGC